MSDNNLSRLLAAVCLMLCGCGCNPVSDKVAEAEKIRILSDEWVSAVRMKDPDRVVTHFSPDFTTISAFASPIEGYDANKKDIESILKDTLVNWESLKWSNDQVEVSSSGDLAYVRGVGRTTVNTDIGPVEFVSNGVDIWKKIDGEWKTAVSIATPAKMIPVPNSSPDIIAKFTEIEQGWIDAIIRKDERALDLVYAPEYYEMEKTGLVNDKKEAIRAIISGDLRFQSGTISDVRATSYSNFTLVTLSVTQKASYKGRDMSGRYQYTDVFINRDDHWQVITSMGRRVD